MDYAEYLDLAVQLIESNERPGVPFPASALGGLLRKAAPDVSFKTFAKRSFGEVLDDLQARGRITLTHTDKGALAMLRVGSGSSVSKQVEAYNPLHKQMWEAFTFVAPQGRRFQNRLHGVIRVGLPAPPIPADEWVEITPISADLQRLWAAEFVKEEVPDLSEALEAFLKPESWNAHVFVTALRQQNPQAARTWNAFRSNRVSMHVQKWLADNSLPPGWAFQQQAAPSRVADVSLPVGPIADDRETREIVLAALAQMPLSQLLTIPIPVGLVLAALSARKR